MSDYKLCPRCNQTFPATTEFFPPFKRNTTTGLFTYCRVCCREKKTEYDNANREEVRRKDREKRQENRSFYSQKHTEWRNRHLEEARAYERRHRLENHEHYLAYSRAFYKKHRDRIIQKQRQADRRIINAKKRDYSKRFPHKNRQWRHNRRARQLALPAEFTDTDWQNALDYWHGCCAYCGAQQDFWHSIEADHYHPLALSGCPGTIPTNMLPACKSCNASKHNRDPHEWLLSKYSAKKTAEIEAAIQGYFDSIDKQA